MLYVPFPLRWMWIGKRHMHFLPVMRIRWQTFLAQTVYGVAFFGKMDFIGHPYLILALIAIQPRIMLVNIPMVFLFLGLADMLRL